MAIDISKLAGYIESEIVEEFQLGQSNEALQKYSQAMSRAISKYLLDDVETATGQQIAGQGTGEAGEETVNTEVTGKVTTKGRLI